jgi:hypothetical protein
MEPGRIFVPVSFFPGNPLNPPFGGLTNLTYIKAPNLGGWGVAFHVSVVNGFHYLYLMTGKYKVITLCGSTKFREEFIEEQKRLTLEGNIVISVGLFGHSGDEEVWLKETKIMLDDMHKRKIDMADEIFVINVGGYIGESTRSEIEYAIKTGKVVKYLV